MIYLLSRGAAVLFAVSFILGVSWLFDTSTMKAAVIYLMLWVTAYDGRLIQGLMEKAGWKR